MNNEIRFSVRFKDDIINHGGIYDYDKAIDIYNDFDKEMVVEFIKRILIVKMNEWKKNTSDIILFEIYLLNDNNEKVIIFEWDINN